MLAHRLLRTIACGAWSPAGVAAAQRRFAAESSADAFAKAAAGGSVQPSAEGEGPMKIHHAQTELPNIGGYGDDPVAAGGQAADATESVVDEAQRATQGVLGEASEEASGGGDAAAEAARGGVAQAASAAKGVMHAAAEPVKPQQHMGAEDEGNVAARGEAPGTSGHAMAGWPRWKKEADDALAGGTPEPGVVLE